MKLQLNMLKNSQKENSRGNSEVKDMTMERKILSFFKPKHSLPYPTQKKLTQTHQFKSSQYIKEQL